MSLRADAQIRRKVCARRSRYPGRRRTDEILAGRAASAARSASPKPLRPIVCRDGVLRYEDGGEVALWGVNLQTALSWEYNGRLKPAGVPLGGGGPEARSPRRTSTSSS